MIPIATSVAFVLRNATIAATKRFIQNSDLPRLLRGSGIAPGVACLEVGCGDGYALSLIKKYLSPNVLAGIDIDPIKVRQAKTRTEGYAEVQAADAVSLPFEAEAFDAVFLFATLHHVANWQGAVKEISRMLRPGGKLVFIEPTRKAFSLPFVRWIDGPAGIFGEEELRKEFAANGFTVLHWQHRGWYRILFKVSVEGICQKTNA